MNGTQSQNEEAGSFNQKFAAVCSRVVSDATDHSLTVDKRIIKSWHGAHVNAAQHYRASLANCFKRNWNEFTPHPLKIHV